MPFFDKRHIVYAPSKYDQYASAGFPNIADAIVDGDLAEIERQISIGTFFIRGASSTLKDYDHFFSQ
jgi:hypothetical protein